MKIRVKCIKLILVITIFTTFSFLVQSQAANGNGPPFRSGEVVVVGEPGTLPQGTTIKKYLPNANLTVIAVEKGKEWGMVQQYRLKGKRAGLNYIAEAFAKPIRTFPNDPFYRYQWHLSKIQSEKAWNISRGNGVTVAVLDTGLATGGIDGIGCILAGYNAITLGDDFTDGHGHGTHVSGTIAQKTNNGIGTAGLAFDACIMPVKVLNDQGSGTSADIAEGIYYAVNNDADVINMSLGFKAQDYVTNDTIIDQALDRAHFNGVTVVCAAGNDAGDDDYNGVISYPAIYPTTIAVGSTGYDNNRVEYSNYGIGLDIMAPGGDMLKDLSGDGNPDGVLQETRYNSIWNYWFFEGTSMATPHVSATAALIIANSGGATPEEVYKALTGTTIDLGTPGRDDYTGWGFVQAYNALNYTESACIDNDKDAICVQNGDCNDSDASSLPGCFGHLR